MVSLVSVLLILLYSQVTPLYAWLLLPLICVLSMLLASPILIHTRWGSGAVELATGLRKIPQCLEKAPIRRLSLTKLKSLN